MLEKLLRDRPGRDSYPGVPCEKRLDFSWKLKVTLTDISTYFVLL
jgi:hypothetical protein